MKHCLVMLQISFELFLNCFLILNFHLNTNFKLVRETKILFKNQGIET